MKRITVALLLLISGWDAAAGEALNADKNFMGIMAWLKKMDGYSYELNIRSEMKARPKERQDQRSMIYSSNAEFIRYISSVSESVFMSRKGIFKINHQSKEATYKQFDPNKLSAEIIAATTVNNPGRLLDSLLFDKASIKGKKQLGDVLEYTLSYENGYMIKNLTLRYDTRRRMLLQVSYVVERYLNGIRQEEAVMRQTVTMSNYKAGPPAELEAILKQSGDLNTYLHTSYAGYTIHNL